MKMKTENGVPWNNLGNAGCRLAVKLFCLLSAVFMLPVTGSANAQEHRISLDAEEVTVEQLIKRIKAAAPVDFLYNIRELERIGKVTVRAEKATVEEILQSAFKGKGLEFSRMNGVIVIRPRVAVPAAQQPEYIRGIVKDKDGLPLPGVTVMIRGYRLGVTTNARGEFEIIRPKGEVVLEFSFIGMKKKSVPYTDGKKVAVVMEDDMYVLDEANVIHTGYQNLDKRRLTSAVTSVRAEDVLVPGMTSIDQALEGQIPELLYTLNSGEVGATGRIRVRGTSSLIGNREPLWVLDGFIIEDPVNVSNEDLNDPDYINLIGNAIAGINPEDIARIDILKDAAATALYGIRAANGVIVVSTKRGAIGEARVSYSHSSKLTRRPRYTDRAVNLMNSQERVHFGKEMVDAHYAFPSNMPMVGYEGAYYRHQTGVTTWEEFQKEVEYYEGVNTDWFKILTHDTYSHNHTVSVSGGSDEIRYYISMGYNFEDGVTRTTNTERYTTSARLDVKFSRDLRLSVGLNGNIQKKDHLQKDIQAMEYAYNTTRALPCFNPDGTPFFYRKSGYGGMNRWYNDFNYNIVNEIRNSSNKYDGNTLSASLDLRWMLVDGLELSASGNYSKSSTLQENWWGEKSHYVARLRNAEYGVKPPQGMDGHCLLPYGGVLNTAHSDVESYTFRSQLDYRNLIGPEKDYLVTAMGGFEVRSSTSRTSSELAYGYMKDRGMQFVDGIDLENYPEYRDWLNRNHRSRGYGVNHTVSGYVALGFGFRNYFDLNGSARIDASNKFGDRSNDRFLPIWSVSARWNIKESLLQGVRFVDNLSLRGSYGFQGNMLSDQSPNLIIRQQSTDAIYNENVSTIARYPNPNLRWEKTKSVDGALDAGLWDSRISLSLSLYYKKTTGCFTSVNVSSVNGVRSYVMNGGVTQNTGYSIYLNVAPVRTKDWRWNLAFNWSGNFNEVKSGTKDTYTYQDYLTGRATVDGESLNTFYSYRFTGLDPSNGVPMFDDYADRRHLLEYKPLEEVVKLAMDRSGKREPVFSGNISTSLKYKAWSLSGNFAYSLGSKIRLLSIYEPVAAGVSSDVNVRKEFISRWRVPGDERVTDIPTIMPQSHPDYDNYVQHYSVQTDKSDHIPTFASNVWNMYDNSDLRVVSGNYLKCSSLSLRYTFENDLLKHTPFNNASISLSALNLFTISAKELKGQHPSQQGFAAVSMSVRPSYTLQFSVTF